MLAPVRTHAPATKVVSLAEVKVHCRIEPEDTEQDSLLGAYIDAAIGHLDGWSGILGRALIAQEWRQDFAGFSSCMRLPLGPVAADALGDITYFDSADATQTLAADQAQLLVDALGPYVVPAAGVNWPGTARRADAVSIVWTAGYGEAGEDVPAPIRVAILMMVAEWYDKRAVSIVGDSVANLPFAADRLISPYRLTRI